MLKVPENKQLRINTPLRGNLAGAVIKIKTDKNGTPHDSYWRRRLKDSKVDGCVEFVDNAKKSKKSATAED